MAHVVRAVLGVKQVGIGTFDWSGGGQAECRDEGEKGRVDHIGWLSGIGLTFLSWEWASVVSLRLSMA